WRRFRNTRWPTFWVQDGPVGSHQYRLRTIFDVVPMQWDWPAVVNYYEAKAYCVWRSERDDVKTPYRLLREKEHVAMRDKNPQAQLQGRQINHNLQFGSEGPVEQFAASQR